MLSDRGASSVTDPGSWFNPRDVNFTAHLLQLPLCVDCEALVKARPKPVHGYWMEAVRSEFAHTISPKADSCSLCFCVWHLFSLDLPQSTAIYLIPEYRYFASNNGPKLVVLGMHAGLKKVSRPFGYVCIGEQYLGQHYEPAATVDFQAISKVLRECEEQHDHHSWNIPRHQSPVSIQLIDVKDLMIISATTQQRYLALSYVWGEHASFATTTKSRESLAQKGGLRKHIIEIPQTVKDAMEVVQNLGERYLWVDRLCIEQDNPAQMEIEIQKMDVIYSHALITIIAHGGLSRDVSSSRGATANTTWNASEAYGGCCHVRQTSESLGLWCA